MLRRLSIPLSKADGATASLVLTELVTNAVRHGCADPGAGIGVTVWRAPGHLRFEVAQSGPVHEPQEVRLRRPGVDRGWGVLILDQVCRSWDVDVEARKVWAEISVDGSPNR